MRICGLCWFHCALCVNSHTRPQSAFVVELVKPNHIHYHSSRCSVRLSAANVRGALAARRIVSVALTFLLARACRKRHACIKYWRKLSLLFTWNSLLNQSRHIFDSQIFFRISLKWAVSIERSLKIALSTYICGVESPDK